MVRTLISSFRDCRPIRSLCGGRRQLILPALMVLLWGATGCKVSPKDVEKWGQAKDGYRLSKAVKDKKQTLEIRTAAAMQLIEIGRFYSLEKALHASTKAHRRTLAGNLMTSLLGRLKTKKITAGELSHAQDGLLSAWYFAAPEGRRKIEEALVSEILKGQYQETNKHSVHLVLDSFGERGAALIAPQVPPDHASLYEFDAKYGVNRLTMVGHLWNRAGPAVRLETTRRFIAAARKDKQLALLRRGALLCAIGVLGRREGTKFLAELLSSKDDALRGHAAAALFYTARTNKSFLAPSVSRAVGAELKKMMESAGKGEAIDSTPYRGTSFILLLLEVAGAFPEKQVFETLMPLLTAKPLGVESIALEDKTDAAKKKQADELLARQDRRTQLRLWAVAFMLQHNPGRSLSLAYQHLPTSHQYHLGYLMGTVIKYVGVVWKENPALRKALLKGLRSGLTSKSWVARLIAVEGLGYEKIADRKDLDKDLAALRRMTGVKQPLKGADWRGETLGDRAKKAIEVLSKRK